MPAMVIMNCDKCGEPLEESRIGLCDDCMGPIVWQLAPDSDPQERFIVTTADGETELTAIIETRELAQAWIDEHYPEGL